MRKVTKWRAMAVLGAVFLIILNAEAVAQRKSGEPAKAENYPARPVRWIVPFPPGGAADIVSRAIGVKLSETWGQQVVMDNRPGAGGNLGIEIASRASPDGYTLVIVPATFTTSPSLQRHLPYDPAKDFMPVTLVSSSALILVVHPSLKAASVRELIALAKSRPGQLNYASSGIGASAHLAAELFKTMAGVNIVHVPYKGQPPAMLDLISGQVQMMFPNAPVALPHLRAGKLRALAVTTLKRSSALPELPTMAESGLAGFEVNQWSGLMVPAGTPKAIIAKLHDDIARALELPDVRKNLTSLGFDPVGSTPEEFSAYIRSEIRKWAKVIADAGIQPQ
ncbi:MAG TPA: tripartite tricarboxylate transporter substrate binding protein [Burkholderiales bacterium]|nr:tripartite tricarboxylate transporter substrate binding protein [Burkholderiales bacterium]